MYLYTLTLLFFGVIKNQQREISVQTVTSYVRKRCALATSSNISTKHMLLGGAQSFCVVEYVL